MAAVGSALEWTAPWGPLPGSRAFLPPPGPSPGAEAEAFLRAPPLSIGESRKKYRVKNHRLDCSTTGPSMRPHGHGFLEGVCLGVPGPGPLVNIRAATTAWGPLAPERRVFSLSFYMIVALPKITLSLVPAAKTS